MSNRKAEKQKDLTKTNDKALPVATTTSNRTRSISTNDCLSLWLKPRKQKQPTTKNYVVKTSPKSESKNGSPKIGPKFADLKSSDNSLHRSVPNLAHNSIVHDPPASLGRGGTLKPPEIPKRAPVVPIEERESSPTGISLAQSCQCFNCIVAASQPGGTKVKINDYLDTMFADPGPQCLLWLPLMHRMANVENVLHPIACSFCNAESMMGFRYKCQRCPNYQLCQTCFWYGQASGNHSNDHEMKEYSTYKSPAKQFTHTLRKGTMKCLPTTTNRVKGGPGGAGGPTTLPADGQPKCSTQRSFTPTTECTQFVHVNKSYPDLLEYPLYPLKQNCSHYLALRNLVIIDSAASQFV